MEKRNVDTIKYLDSIIAIASRLKEEIEQDIISVDVVMLDDIKKVDDAIDLIEMYVKG